MEAPVSAALDVAGRRVQRACLYAAIARRVGSAFDESLTLSEDQLGERSLALPPLTRVLIALDLEAATGIEIPVDALIDVETVGDWIDLMTCLAEARSRLS
jgi:hypothetical protein